LALLFAPTSGKKTRAQIAQATTDGVAQARDTVRDSARTLVERGKEALSRPKNESAAAAAD
jgi:gas vesicle protein